MYIAYLNGSVKLCNRKNRPIRVPEYSPFLVSPHMISLYCLTHALTCCHCYNIHCSTSAKYSLSNHHYENCNDAARKVPNSIYIQCVHG
ncbi:hypothetical protein EUGRSUZ_E00033 [Eucalyptus grandis]|uniref:Uncharacterized protein n=2 Tax=Eucalyptus grandis TaxID=71139 RepID=A0ACC3KQC7_EUCGR|nr:hypothetical protein EUGRSUZ_E00033 [Eucalyptus grandis]